MLRIIICSVIMLACGAAFSQETPIISPAKAAQLQRLEPLTPDKIDVFVEAGQLTAEQAAYVKRHIGPQGQLALPDASIVDDRREPAPRDPRPVDKPREDKGVRASPYADFNYRLSRADQDNLIRAIRSYRHGDRPAVGRELRKFRPEVNELLNQAYTDPVDIAIKVKLWEEVAGPADPAAAIGLFETHRAAYSMAKPILIAFEKDIGGLEVRRMARHADAAEEPRQRWFSSRDMRDIILEIEYLISRCSGASAAIFLMDVYSRRYDAGEAPMRDSDRDRKRMVEACGGNPKKFDDDERDTWKSKLPASDRAVIAEYLIPWLHRSNGDRRKIAKSGLMLCLPRGHPKWDDGRGEWERWWAANKEKLGGE
jgi:hypothetical protein